MDKIYNNDLRNGNFTSSEIVALLGEPTAAAKKQGEIFGAGAKTYIKQCNRERRHGLPLDLNISAPPINWGRCCEVIAFNNVGTDYDLKSDVTIQHKQHNWWSGSPDGFRYNQEIALNAVIDFKCPQTRDSFSQLVDKYYEDSSRSEEQRAWECILDIRENHKDGDKYYYQLVSNAIITDKDYAELIIFMPYERELRVIKERAQELYDAGERQYYFIANAKKDELPYIREHHYYKNITTLRFKVPQIDKDLLTQRAIEASKQLIKRIC